jgi:hypothetical protein
MIHKVGDGRGNRQVYLNDKPIAKAFYADTVKGVVRCYREPLKLHKYRKRALTRTLHGKVRVEYI